ncbi:MAG: hypothetical protein M3P18_15230 [Actinomycetota bacterium]|nr:hypothetical protein [Actinomycetota bacterium]
MSESATPFLHTAGVSGDRDHVPGAATAPTNVSRTRHPACPPDVEWLMGNQEPAMAALAEATTIALGAPSPMLLAQIAYPSQIVLLHTERYRDAAVLQGVRERLEQDFEVTFPETGASLIGDPGVAAREALGDDAYAEAAAIGRAMDLEQMVQLLAGIAG